MVLVFSISDTRLCQTFKVFFQKRREVGKTTNLPPANSLTHDNEGQHTLRPRTYHIRSILQGENDLARIGLLE